MSGPHTPLQLPDPAELDQAILEAPESFLTSAADLGIVLEPVETQQLGLYLGYLLWANQRVNLTAIRDAHEAWTRHVLDSLTLMGPLSELPDDSTVIDVGSGGGVPGIPLAIALPNTRFTLLEATGKKARFLKQVAARLGLDNVIVLNERAERACAAESPHREQYSAAIARAVGPIRVVVELTVPFTRVEGLTLLIKGARAQDELEDARQALHALHASHAGTIATPTGRLVVLEKRRSTPRMYPRREGEPKRSPL